MKKREALDVMDLKSLRCFSTMGRHGSLTRAGVELGISEVRVSQRVKALEHYLGVKLYESRGGRVRLTPAGERTMALAVSMFDELREFEHVIARGEETGEIVLCSFDPVLGYFLPDIVEKFTRAHPLARLRLLARAVEDTVRMVRMNECDLGVIPEQSLPPELILHVLATYPAYLLTPKGHPLARRARADFKSLLNEDTIRQFPLIVAEVQIEGHVLEETFARLGLPLNVGIEVGTITTLKQFVTRGLGVAVVSGLCLVDADRSSMEIVEIPAELGGESTYGVVVRKDKHRSRLLADLLMLLGVGAAKRS